FPGQITWRRLKLASEEELMRGDGSGTGLLVEAVAVPGKPPIHLEDGRARDPEDNIGLRIREASTGRRLAYFSAPAGVTPTVRDALADADCAFFDGRF